MEKTLKYCIKGTDTFIQFAESPAGTYYLNIDKRLVIFIASGNMSNEDAYRVDGLMAVIGVASDVETAHEIKFIHDTFITILHFSSHSIIQLFKITHIIIIFIVQI